MLTSAVAQQSAGLSPRVRGKLLGDSGGEHNFGTIPASAGETAIPRLCLCPGWDYPRECGGNTGAITAWAICTGLSPRVRGKLGQLEHVFCRNGTIPASAGETRTNPFERGHFWDYPRECGGNIIAHPLARRFSGLSPRVRGKLQLRRHLRIAYGTIPASAGETKSITCTIRFMGDYPRECGGNFFVFAFGVHVAGLSPRVRGKPSLSIKRPSWLGTIPASAGETPLHRISPASFRDYPRECGGNSSRRALELSL